MEGNVTRGRLAEEGVGGGASCALARVFRVVGESVSSAGRREGRRDGGSDGGSVVCNDSFGRLWFETDVGGMAESMVLATFLRSSDVWGVSSRCVLGV